MLREELKPNAVIEGPFFPEPVQVVVMVPLGGAIKLVGKGEKTNQSYDPVLTDDQIAPLAASPETEPSGGDPARFRLGIGAQRLGLAYEYDP